MVGIAIVGMACRLPGGIDSIDDLWSALENRLNTATHIPEDRWSADHYFSEDERAPGKAYVQRGNFLKQDIRTMDAAFFDLPPRIAENLDPQQRLMLEVVWEAFENAGLSLPDHAGTNVGVYVGGFMLDHMITHMDVVNRAHINQNTAAGMMMTMLSNRISHAFDLRGPSLSIDTACSSSLTAFNYGCQDIWRGTCDMALVGGVNVMTRHQYPLGMCKGQFLARDGECKSFDERGDGYGRGEGAGVVLLKKLDKAIEDGDPILATVLATGVNSDGRTPGISMPSGDAQKQLIEDVCRGSGIDPKSVNYVECHGTGTAIGDPTEAKSIGMVFGHDRSEDDRVVIGSIKSNIGHTEAAAGIAGVIKAVLTLQNRTATPLANLKTPNPNIPFDELGLRLSDDLISLGKEGEPLRAAVNSFGYGGTNAHAILESAPERSTPPPISPLRPDLDFPRMLPLSARSDKALAEMAGQFVDHIEASDGELDDILYSASYHRAHLSHRAMVLGDDASSLVDGLQKLAAGELTEKVATGQAPFAANNHAVFVYTGMGPQWWAMGQELYQENQIFRETLNEADEIFKEVAGFSILAEMLKDEDASEITKTEFAQPANLMVQLGLTALLKEAGVEPGAFIGHSVGEVASAQAAGALTLREALTVSYHRSRTQAKTAGTGSMLAVGLSEEKLRPYLEKMGDKVDIAAINGPGSLTVSGDTDCIHELMDALTAEDIFNRELRVEVPYHSYLMDPITDELISALEGIKPALPSALLYSTVTGSPVEGVAYDGPYWAANVRLPVAFMKAVNGLLDQGYTTFIQVGPHPVLSAALRECARSRGKDIRIVETLRRGDKESPCMHKSLAHLYTSGAAIDWSRHNPPGQFVQLPNYAWQRERHWLETDRSLAVQNGMIKRPFLGIRDSSAARIWRNDVDHESVAYLADHVVTGVPVMPAAAYLETLFQLGEEVLDDGQGVELRDVRIAAPLTLTPGRGVEIVTSHDPAIARATIRSADIGSVGDGQLHMSAEILPMSGAITERHDLDILARSFGPAVDIAAFYTKLADLGLQYGPAFRAIKELRFNVETGEALARLELDPDYEDTLDTYRVHPSLKDGCLQMLMGILPDKSTLYLPTGFRSIRVAAGRSRSTIWCHGRFVGKTAKTIECDLKMMDETGRVFGVVRGMQATAGAGRNMTRTDKWGDPVKLWVLNYEWKPTPTMLAEPKRIGSWIVFSDSEREITAKITARIEAIGATAHRIVKLGDAYAEDGNEITIRPGSLDDIRKLLGDAGRLDGVFFGHGLDAGLGSRDPTGEQAIETLAVTLKTLAERTEGPRPRIYVATQLAFSTDNGATAVTPAQTAINGFTRVAHNELEGMKVSTIDLPTRIDDALIDAVAFELTGDAKEDEIALRGRQRLMSEVIETGSLFAPSRIERQIGDDAPALIRAAKDPSVDGMVDLIGIDPPVLGDADIALRVEAMSMPSKVLLDANSETLEQPFVAIVGTIQAAGSEVGDLQVGTRVFGFAPSEIATSLSGPRASFHLVALDPEVDAETALGALARDVLAEHAASVSDLDEGDAILVLASDHQSVAVGQALARRGVRVDSIDTNKRPLTPEAVEAAVTSATAGRGYDAIVAPASRWLSVLNFDGLRKGGTLIDCGAEAALLVLPESVSQIVRTDLAVAAGRPRRLHAALASIAQRLRNGEVGSAGDVNSFPIPLSRLVSLKMEAPPPNFGVNLLMDLQKESYPVITETDLAFDPTASYLITGGLGGFGQKTARWLADHGARHIVLASRSGANSPEKQAFIAELAALDVIVETPKVDLADRDAVLALVDKIKADMPPLKGVFHSAAVFEDQGIIELDISSFRRVMRAKASSALALHEATRDLPLDHFVLYSSVATSVGNSRQPAYAAANGFLDGLAWQRRTEGLAGTSVNWGAIADVGVVQENEETEQFLRYMGISGLSSSEALVHLESVIKRQTTQIAIVLMTSWADWARYETIGSQSLRLASVIAADIEAAGGDSSEVRQQLITDLASIPEEERLDVLAGLIMQLIANELRTDPSTISIDRPINELGVDSLMATEIQLLLEKDLGIKIAVMDMLGDTSVRLIAERSLSEFGFAEQTAAE